MGWRGPLLLCFWLLEHYVHLVPCSLLLCLTLLLLDFLFPVLRWRGGVLAALLGLVGWLGVEEAVEVADEEGVGMRQVHHAVAELRRESAEVLLLPDVPEPRLVEHGAHLDGEVLELLVALLGPTRPGPLLGCAGLVLVLFVVLLAPLALGAAVVGAARGGGGGLRLGLRRGPAVPGAGVDDILLEGPVRLQRTLVVEARLAATQLQDQSERGM